MEKIILKFQMDVTKERDTAVTRATALTWRADEEEEKGKEKQRVLATPWWLPCVPELLPAPEAPPRLTCGLCKVHTPSRGPGRRRGRLYHWCLSSEGRV